jgi:tetratricopeptide (TPR) repeat protein
MVGRVDAPDPLSAATATAFVERLVELRLWSGQPSMRMLRQLGGARRTPRGDTVDALAPSTVSWMLSGKGLPKLPRLEFVESYVSACAAFCGYPEAEIDRYLDRWRQAWRVLANGASAETGPAADSSSSEATPRERPGPAPRRPALLPADGRFVGRRDQLRLLDSLLPNGSEDVAGMPLTIATISGMAGVGKTALAVHWAHQVADQFPDGQLYVNLRGFTSSGMPLTPAAAVRGFLEELCPASERIPTDPAAQTARYRSLLAGRRMLLVLDNAHDAEQVRPLLPGSGGCLVLVTSRDRLTGLVAGHGARPVPVGLFTFAEADELMRDRLGPERVRSDRTGSTELAERCAYLPLATAIAAARAAVDPARSLTSLAAELADVPTRLDALDTGDPGTDLRSVFSWSYRALSPDAQRLFRFLGLFPASTTSLPVAASLIGLPVPDTRRLLAELTQVNLLAEHAPGRFALHDLLGAYATELAAAHDTATERHTAQLRVLDHFVHTAQHADHWLNPQRDRAPLAPPLAGVAATEFEDAGTAIDWLTAETPAGLALVEFASRHGFDAQAHQLASLLATFLDQRGRWDDEVSSQLHAVAAAQRIADRAAEARAHRTLAHAYGRLRRYDDAQAHARRSLDLAARAGDDTGRANAYLRIAYLYEDENRPADTIDAAQHALEFFRRAGSRSGQADTLNLIGWCHALLGRYDEALDRCAAARELHRELGDLRGEAAALDSLGYAHHQLGQYAQAVDHFRDALRHYESLGGYRPEEIDVLVHLGDSYRALGTEDRARKAWHRAAALIDQTDMPGHPHAERLRIELGHATVAG